MSKWSFVIPLIVLGPLVGACASASAKTVPAERPALVVPPPPPRVVETAPAPDPVPEPVADLPPPPAPIKPARPSRETTSRQQTVTPAEPKTGETVNPEPTPPPAAPAPPQPPLQLRTPQTADSTEAERAIRATMDRANSSLGAVNFNRLSNERKKAYNDAKLYLQQAEDALKQGNFVYGQNIANKAETLARELAGK
ncbi:MAG: hypothetical protein HOQ29_04270 [Acidobacteria bacterium]|nr:hypothetical protein [Acidobacteriota bacterium]